jgi:hypothetical protein
MTVGRSTHAALRRRLVKGVDSRVVLLVLGSLVSGCPAPTTPTPTPPPTTPNPPTTTPSTPAAKAPRYFDWHPAAITATVSGVRADLKRLAVLPRTAARLEKEPVSDDLMRAGNGSFIACELEVSVDGTPLYSKDLALKSVGPLVVHCGSEELRQTGSGYVGSHVDRPAWFYEWRSIDSKARDGDYRVTLTITRPDGLATTVELGPLTVPDAAFVVD